MKKKNVKKISGFTLIELLVVIAIIAVISVLAFALLNNLTSTTDDASKLVNQESILDSAVLYVNEKKRESDWIESQSDTTKSFVCVKVKELINYGYLNNSVLNSSIKTLDGTNLNGDSVIKITRNFSKVIDSKKILSSSDTECNFYLATIPSINYSTILNTDNITITANCDAGTSTKITNYLFSIGTDSFIDKKNENTHVFNSLRENTPYNIGIKCLTDAGKENSVTVSLRTSELKTPTYSIQKITTEYASSRYVDISYDNTNVTNAYNLFKITGTAKANNIVYKCSDVNNINSCTTSVSANTTITDGMYKTLNTSVRLTYTTNGFLDITLSDGSNKKVVSNIGITNIDSDSPSIGNFGLTNYKYNTYGSTNYYSLIQKQVKVTDSGSGIKSVKYCFTTGNNCTPNITGTLVNDVMTINFDSAKSSKQLVCVEATDNIGKKIKKCDTSSYYFDNTAPINVTASRTQTSDYQKKFLTSATDSESRIWKYEYYYSVDNVNWTLDHTYETAYSSSDLLDSRLESNKTYYFKVIVYNRAGLSTTSSVVTFTPSYNPEYASSDLTSCDDKFNEEIYFKYGKYLYFIYSSNDKAIFNGFYKLSASPYRFSSLQNFIDELPSNHEEILDLITSPTGYVDIEIGTDGEFDVISTDHLYDTAMSGYAALPGYDFKFGNLYSTEKRIKNYEGWDGIYWYSNDAKDDSITSGHGALIVITDNDSMMYGYQVNGDLKMFINFCDDFSGVYKCVNTYVRPIIDLKSTVTFASGDGTKDNPFIIEG